MKRIALLTALALLAACSDPTEPEKIDYQSIGMEIISGQAQVAAVADTLPDPCSVKVTEAGGAAGSSTPAVGVLVNFVVTEGGGSVFAGAALTSEEGIATERWIMGTVAGEQAMEARAVKPDGTPVVYETFEATAEPGPITTWYGSYITHGTWGAFVPGEIDITAIDPPLITAEDEYGNVVTDAQITIVPTGGKVSWDPPVMSCEVEALEVPEVWVERVYGPMDVNTEGIINFSFMHDLRDFDMTIDGVEADTLYYTPSLIDRFLTFGDGISLTVEVPPDTLMFFQSVNSLVEVDSLYIIANNGSGNLVSKDPRTYEALMLDGTTRTIVITPKS